MVRRKRDGFVMISVIAERYNLHPQTLRLYEREGLITPARTEGNTRLYGPDQIRRLETILVLTRDLGVNLAGVEVILDMQKEIEKSNLEVELVMNWIRQNFFDRRSGVQRENALIKMPPRFVVRVR